MFDQTEVSKRLDVADAVVESLISETPEFAVYRVVKEQLQQIRKIAKQKSIDLDYLWSLPLWRITARELEEVPRPKAMELVKLIYEIGDLLDPE